MGDTMGCGVVSIRVNRHFSRHGKLGPPEGRELGLVYTIRKAPADNGTLRRGTTSDERKGRPCWRFHCPAWWSNSQENMQINYLQRLTRKLRLGVHSSEPERVPTQPKSNWFRWSGPPSSWWRRLGSASPKAGPRLVRKTQVAPAALGTPCLCGTRPARPKPHEKTAGWSAGRSAVLPVVEPLRTLHRNEFSLRRRWAALVILRNSTIQPDQ